MIVSRHTLRRLRAAAKTTSEGITLEELIHGLPDRPMVQAERARREAEAAAAAEKAALPPQPTEASPADPAPPAPQTPPPEPKWYEGMCRWRPRDASDSYEGDREYYETIHEYDPLAWIDEEVEEEYGPDG